MIDFAKYKLVDSRIGAVLSNWYLSHTTRDQTIFKFVAILALLTFVWAIILQPLLNWHTQQKNSERLMYSLLTTIKNNTNELLNSGIDVITTGNHVWDKKETFEFISNQKIL